MLKKCAGEKQKKEKKKEEKNSDSLFLGAWLLKQSLNRSLRP